MTNPSREKKILILRFSSFGDVLQCLSVAGAIQTQWPEARIHWVTRSDLKGLIESHPAISQVWTIERGHGYKELRNLAKQLVRERYTHVYDAHNNLRSRILCWTLNGWFNWRKVFRRHFFLRRSLKRWKRFFLFRLRINLYPQPFNGQRDLLEPLAEWGLSVQAPPSPQLFLPPEIKISEKLPVSYVALAPSAAHPLKRWPLAHWEKLIELLPDAQFVVLGGSEDHFLQTLAEKFPDRVSNWAGKLSLLESAKVIQGAQLLIANDTGLLHVAEQLGIYCIALMGPAPFGYPSREKTEIMELNLSCRPCSKHGQGPCVNPQYKKCLVDIRPESVIGAVKSILT